MGSAGSVRTTVHPARDPCPTSSGSASWQDASDHEQTPKRRRKVFLAESWPSPGKDLMRRRELRAQCHRHEQTGFDEVAINPLDEKGASQTFIGRIRAKIEGRSGRLGMGKLCARVEQQTQTPGPSHGKPAKDEEEEVLTPTVLEESEAEDGEVWGNSSEKEPEENLKDDDDDEMDVQEMIEHGEEEEEQMEHDPEVNVKPQNPDAADTLEMLDMEQPAGCLLGRPDSGEWQWNLDPSQDTQEMTWVKVPKKADEDFPATQADQNEETGMPLVEELFSDGEDESKGTFQDFGRKKT
eukprot:Skav203643  [mRNA]  locus=scaffold1120:365010:371029:+ [translate_table: standard]